MSNFLSDPCCLYLSSFLKCSRIHSCGLVWIKNWDMRITTNLLNFYGKFFVSWSLWEVSLLEWYKRSGALHSNPKVTFFPPISPFRQLEKVSQVFKHLNLFSDLLAGFCSRFSADSYQLSMWVKSRLNSWGNLVRWNRIVWNNLSKLIVHFGYIYFVAYYRLTTRFLRFFYLFIEATLTIFSLRGFCGISI